MRCIVFVIGYKVVYFIATIQICKSEFLKTVCLWFSLEIKIYSICFDWFPQKLKKLFDSTVNTKNLWISLGAML